MSKLLQNLNFGSKQPLVAKSQHATTDYRVVPVDILGKRGALTRVWQVHTGRYHRVVAEFTSRREALDELALLVNEAAGRDEQEGTE